MRESSIAHARVLLVLLASMLTPLAFSAEPAALVLELSGDARLGNGRAVEMLQELQPMAELVLAASTHLVVLHHRAQASYALTGPGTFVIRTDSVQGTGSVAPPAAKPLSTSYSNVRLRPAGVAQATVPMRGAGGSGELELIAPVATWVLEARPMLRWAPAPAASSYEVQVTDTENRMLLETQTKAVSLAIPERVSLERGRIYGWQVTARLDDGSILQGWAEFGIADESLRARLEAARPASGAGLADRIAFALLLEALNAREAAGIEWRRMVEEHPGDARLRALVDKR
jgi:hypothetical protein